MNMDPSAYFSVLWVGENFVTNKNLEAITRTMNYTYYGANLYESPGVWTSAEITITGVTKESKLNSTVTFPLVIFLGFADPPDAGLDGTLGLADSTIEEISLIQ